MKTYLMQMDDDPSGPPRQQFCMGKAFTKEAALEDLEEAV